MKIAVFTKDQQRFRNFVMGPEEDFIRVRDFNDIAGLKFDGIIAYIDWFKNEKVLEAYEVLRERQPELFKRHGSN
jgi:hypothetical protein